MKMKTVAGRALVVVLIIIFTCSQVSAYSAEAVSLYDAGRDLTESGNYSGALSVYNRATTLEPAYFEAWNGLADALNRDGQFGDALAASNHSLGINPNYVTGWINRGQILYNIGYYYEDVAGDVEKAEALYAEQLDAFEQALSLDPDNAEAWFNKGYALAGMKRYDEAVVAFDRVGVINPSYPNLRKNREIAVQLQKLSTPGITGMTTTIPSPTVISGVPSRQQTATPAPSTPVPVEVAVFALLGTIFLRVQRT
jgi:tetratricopeptide (TPR) repeat protein